MARLWFGGALLLLLASAGADYGYGKSRRSLTSMVSQLASKALTTTGAGSGSGGGGGDLSSLPTSWEEFVGWSPPPTAAPAASAEPASSSTTKAAQSSAATVSDAPARSADSRCGPSGFMCDVHKIQSRSGGAALTCLPLSWQCDNVIDCPDASDENGCGTISTNCPPNHLVCHSLLCVSAALRCDGIDDCGDGTDETDCPALPTAVPAAAPPKGPACGDGKYACIKGGCVPRDALCDGYVDCPQGDDESQCAASVSAAARRSCPDGKFRCRTSADCIDARWQCDGAADCLDRSDEEFCSGGEPLLGDDEYERAVFASCTSGQFKCIYGEPRCVDRSHLCDGHCDCVGCGDEGGSCGACERHDCDYFCTDGPDGPQCTCPNGMMLDAADGRRCHDTDECLSATDGCDQICYNVRASYACMCAAGFDLRHDHRCVLQQPDAGSIVVLFNHEIRVLPMTETAARSGRAYDTMSLSSTGFVCDAELMPAAEEGGEPTLYYGTKMNAGTQGRLYVHRDAWVCMLDNVVGLSSIAVDYVTGNLYYTASAPAVRPGVGACSPDAHCAMLVVDADAPFVRSVLLEPGRARMFWIDADLHKPAIRTALMDGSRVETVVDSKLSLPTGLAIDTHRQNLYWGDSDMKMIERINLHTMNREVVLSRGVRHPNDMAFFDHALYWTDSGLDAVLSVDVRNASQPHRRLVKSFGSPPASLALSHPATEAQAHSGGNPCEQAACVHLCLLTVHKEPSLAQEAASHANDNGEQVTASCACPDGYGYDRSEHVCRPDGSGAHLQLVHTCEETAELLCMSIGGMCHNGGLCFVDEDAFGVPTYSCQCPAGFDGFYCEVVLHAATVSKRASSDWAAGLLCVLGVVAALACALCVAKRQRAAVYWTKQVSSVSARVPSPHGLISWPQSALRKLDHRFMSGLAGGTGTGGGVDTSVSYHGGADADRPFAGANASSEALIVGGSPGERVPLCFDNQLYGQGEAHRGHVYKSTTVHVTDDALSASGEHDVLLEHRVLDESAGGKYHDNDSGISGNDSAIVNV